MRIRFVEAIDPLDKPNWRSRPFKLRLLSESTRAIRAIDGS
jgi:hypothetical protein